LGGCPAIEKDPLRLSGAWVCRGTRIPVAALFENLEHGVSLAEFVELFPGVTLEQARSEQASTQLMQQIEAQAARKLDQLVKESLRIAISAVAYAIGFRSWPVCCHAAMRWLGATVGWMTTTSRSAPGDQEQQVASGVAGQGAGQERLT
jgi:uncharacterized protein (DUF433 family)